MSLRPKRETAQFILGAVHSDWGKLFTGRRFGSLQLVLRSDEMIREMRELGGIMLGPAQGL
jgi:hypothetical protein